jgi:glycosyltransferase involved in cell wall biosynthesis
MAHEAARLVACSAGLPLVVDFRDPWSLIERVGGEKASPIWFALAERKERRVVRQASVIAMNTEPATEAMRRRYPEASERIITVWNGSDDEPLPASEADGRFTIRFAGEIYIDRDPRLVFRAAAAVVNRLRLTPRDFGMLFIGDVSHFDGVPLQEIAAREGLAGFVEAGPFRPRAEAQKFLAAGTMLLSLPQDSDLAVPAKIFEYLRFDAWLLVLARAGTATAQLLRGSGGDVVDPGDLSALTHVIGERYEQYKRGERPRALATGGRFDRRLQAEALSNRIEQVVSGRDQR